MRRLLPFKRTNQHFSVLAFLSRDCYSQDLDFRIFRILDCHSGTCFLECYTTRLNALGLVENAKMALGMYNQGDSD
jgi:hypothetical protein